MKKTQELFHLVSPSPWPVVFAIAIFTLFIGLIFYARDITPYTLFVGIVLLLFACIGWFLDIIKESQTKAHNNLVRRGFRYGFIAFIISEVMLFVAIFWGYFNSSLIPLEIHGNVWPPKGIVTIDPWELPYFNTILLLFSGSIISQAHSAMARNDTNNAFKYTLLTIVLGILFLAIQVYEYCHAPFSLNDGVYSAIFFLATGTHGVHVLLGILMLSVCCIRLKLNHYTSDDCFGFESSVWYWHFVDVVWLLLFIVIYWLGNSNNTNFL